MFKKMDGLMCALKTLKKEYFQKVREINEEATFKLLLPNTRFLKKSSFIYHFLKPSLFSKNTV